MYEKKLTKELLKKIQELDLCCEKIYSIQVNELGDSWDDSDAVEELEKTNFEYHELWNRRVELEDEIHLLTIDTKYYPLVNVGPEITNSIIFRPTYLHVNIGDGAGGRTTKLKLINEKDIEKHLDSELFRNREEMKIRLGKIGGLNLSSEISPRTRVLYKQIIQSFIFGFFDSCCVLCRAIAEQTATRYIEFNDFGNLLVGANNNKKKMSIYEILDSKLEVSKEILIIYRKISSKADRILHERTERATEEDALDSINRLQEFLKEFPSCK